MSNGFLIGDVPRPRLVRGGRSSIQDHLDFADKLRNLSIGVKSWSCRSFRPLLVLARVPLEHKSDVSSLSSYQT